MWVYVVEGMRAVVAEEVIKTFDRCAAELGLQKSLEQHKPTRSHWHWKRAGASGTLEATYEVEERRILVIVHQNRVGLDEWAKKLAKELGGTAHTQHATHRR